MLWNVQTKNVLSRRLLEGQLPPVMLPSIYIHTFVHRKSPPTVRHLQLITPTLMPANRGDSPAQNGVSRMLHRFDVEI